MKDLRINILMEPKISKLNWRKVIKMEKGKWKTELIVNVYWLEMQKSRTKIDESCFCL